VEWNKRLKKIYSFWGEETKSHRQKPVVVTKERGSPKQETQKEFYGQKVTPGESILMNLLANSSCWPEEENSRGGTITNRDIVRRGGGLRKRKG